MSCGPFEQQQQQQLGHYATHQHLTQSNASPYQLPSPVLPVVCNPRNENVSRHHHGNDDDDHYVFLPPSFQHRHNSAQHRSSSPSPFLLQQLFPSSMPASSSHAAPHAVSQSSSVPSTEDAFLAGRRRRSVATANHPRHASLPSTHSIAVVGGGVALGGQAQVGNGISCKETPHDGRHTTANDDYVSGVVTDDVFNHVMPLDQHQQFAQVAFNSSLSGSWTSSAGKKKSTDYYYYEYLHAPPSPQHNEEATNHLLLLPPRLSIGSSIPSTTKLTPHVYLKRGSCNFSFCDSTTTGVVNDDICGDISVGEIVVASPPSPRLSLSSIATCGEVGLIHLLAPPPLQPTVPTTFAENSGGESSSLFTPHCGGESISFALPLAISTHLHNIYHHHHRLEIDHSPPVSETTKKEKKFTITLSLERVLVLLTPTGIPSPPSNTRTRGQNMSPCAETTPDVIISDMRTTTTPLAVNLFGGRHDFDKEHRGNVKVYYRPHLVEFIATVAEHFDIAIFSTGEQDYVDALLDVMDPSGQVFPKSRRYYRQHCTKVVCHTAPDEVATLPLAKDLRLFGLPLSEVILADDTTHSGALQPRNLLLIPTWTGDPTDTGLLKLMEELVRHTRSNYPDITSAT